MDLMFDIIQEHKKTTEIIYERLNNVPHGGGNGLISVSDTEPHHQNTQHQEDDTDDDDDDYTDSKVI